MKGDVSPIEVIKLLVSLKGLYKFRELENYLGIPSQVLWRYTSYINVPEKATAKKILSQIEKNDLILRSLNSIIYINRYGFVELWRINKNVNLLNLFAYLICRHVKNRDSKINIVLPLSIDAIPIATITANWLDSSLGSLYYAPYLTMDRWISRKYIKKGGDKAYEVFLPKDLIKKSDNILMIDLILSDASLANSLAELILDHDANPWGIVSILPMQESQLNELNKELIKNIFIVIKEIPKKIRRNKDYIS